MKSIPILEAISKGLIKYIAALGYFDKALIVSSATSGVRFFGTPLRIESTSFSFAFSITTGIIKKLLKITRNKKKKHNKIVMLARSKLNSTEMVISQVSIDSEISDEEYTIIINE